MAQPPIQYHIGDATIPLFPKKRGLLFHACNDAGRWGKGFVLSISRRYAAPEAIYREWAKRPSFKLGAVQFVRVSENFAVCNAVCCHFQGRVSPLNLKALAKCLSQIPPCFDYVQMPRIGTGLGATPWTDVETVIEGWAAQTGMPVHVISQP